MNLPQIKRIFSYIDSTIGDAALLLLPLICGIALVAGSMIASIVTTSPQQSQTVNQKQ